MKFNVNKRFKDKYTGEIYLPGDTFKSDDDKRIEDLINRKLINQNEDLSNLTKKELQALLDEREIEHTTRLKKDELISLLGGD